MNRLRVILALLCVCGAALAEPAAPPAALRNPAYIVVTPGGPADGGDFGPATPGTRTSGIQEALNAAKVQRRDLYIAGGAMPGAFANGAVYFIQETLRVPWFQDFRLDGGEYVIQYTPDTGDAVVFDSLMSCHIKLGLIVAQTDGAVIHFKPETKGPDNFSVITASVFEFNAAVGGGKVFPEVGNRGRGIGLWLDGADGPVLNNRISLVEPIACDKAVYATGQVLNNHMQFVFTHLSNTALDLGSEPGSTFQRNRVSASMDSQGIAGAVGAVIGGENNLFDLDFSPGDKGVNIRFAANARANRVTALNLPGKIENLAETPTNLVLANAGPGFSVETPAVPASGESLTNRQPFVVEALITEPGEVKAWTLVAAGTGEQSFSGPLHTGQSIRLEPGDSLRLDHGKAPAWRWRALR
jgi:hypothetical protein